MLVSLRDKHPDLDYELQRLIPFNGDSGVDD